MLGAQRLLIGQMMSRGSSDIRVYDQPHIATCLATVDKLIINQK